MKTLYTTLMLALLVAFSASAQNRTPLTSEDFTTGTFATYKVSAGTAANWAVTSDVNSNSGTGITGGNYIVTVDNNTPERVLTSTVNALGFESIVITWYERMIIGNKQTVSRSFSYSVGDGAPKTKLPTEVITSDWVQKTVTLDADADNQTDIRLTWNITKASRSSNNFAFDELRATGIVAQASLPVELASFKGQTVAKAAKLAWVTATEKNNDKFVVERSQDGKSFSQIGEVKGSGNSAIKRSYSYTDNAPAAGVNYYRLRQVDTDGTESYSSVVALEVASAGIEASVYPTVASKAVTISMQNMKGAASISVVDATGRPVATFTNTTARSIELPVQNLKSGMYFVRVADGQNQQVQRFIKE